MLQQFKERYQQYEKEATLVRRKSSPADGLFGFGNDPRNHPCHVQFYEDVGKLVQEFLAQEPDARQSFEVARFLIAAPVELASLETYWMMYAAQGWCRGLVDRLDPADCAGLRELFDKCFPRRDRMPVQQELYKALKKGAGKR